MLELKDVTINGKAYFDNEESEVTVEVGKGEKGSYKTKYRLKSPGQAVLYFNGINIGNGYKKRLRLHNRDSKPISIATAYS